MSGLWKRLQKRLQKRRRLDRDLEDELRFHLEMKIRDTGNEREARQRIGNLAALKETCRDMWTFNAIESLWKDLRYGARSLWKSRGVTAAAIGALALGIGANTAVFTIVNAALSASLEIGVEQPERLVVVTVTGQMRRDSLMTSFRDFLNLRNEVKSVKNLAAYRWFPVNVSGRGGLPERYYCVQISANGFGVTTKQPMLGRAFSPADELPGAAPVALLSHSVWQDRYGKDASLIGQTIRIDDVPTTIVGVMPPGMQFPEGADLWIPLVSTAQNARTLILFGRLAPGVSLAGARSEMRVLTARLAAKYPETFKGVTVGLLPFLEMYGVYASRPLFLTLFLRGGICAPDRLRRRGESALVAGGDEIAGDLNSHRDRRRACARDPAAIGGERFAFVDGRIFRMAHRFRRPAVVRRHHWKISQTALGRSLHEAGSIHISRGDLYRRRDRFRLGARAPAIQGRCKQRRQRRRPWRGERNEGPLPF
ncbi:MAG TPA: ABC transporter permease [Bryobacteraceae bacterium]